MVATTNAPVQAEEQAAKVKQSVSAAVPQQASGYRRKRNNKYGSTNFLKFFSNTNVILGDEVVAPSGTSAAVVSAPEQAPAAVPAPAASPAVVKSSGY